MNGTKMVLKYLFLILLHLFGHHQYFVIIENFSLCLISEFVTRIISNDNFSSAMCPSSDEHETI